MVGSRSAQVLTRVLNENTYTTDPHSTFPLNGDRLCLSVTFDGMEMKS